jgi:hypothetical protein
MCLREAKCSQRPAEVKQLKAVRNIEFDEPAHVWNRGFNVLYDMILLAENDHADKRKEIASSDCAFRFGIGVCFETSAKERRHAYGRN